MRLWASPSPGLPLQQLFSSSGWALILWDLHGCWAPESESVFTTSGTLPDSGCGTEQLRSMLDELRTKSESQLPAWKGRSPGSVCSQERRGSCRNAPGAWAAKGPVGCVRARPRRVHGFRACAILGRDCGSRARCSKEGLRITCALV